MKFFIALFAIALAASASASYVSDVVPVSTSVWPPYGLYGKASPLGGAWPFSSAGWNNWNNWNGLAAAYPYSQHHSWSSAWPSVNSVYGGYGPYGAHKTVVQANVAKAYPWGQSWGTYGAGVYGWGHQHGGYLSSVPVHAKQIAATPGSVHVAPVPIGGANVIVA